MSRRSLSGLDASFLYLETPEQPMHVASLTLYTLPPAFAKAPKTGSKKFFQTMRSHLHGRIHLASLFTHVLAYAPFDLGHPNWEAADEIDLDYHIQRVTLPAPGTMRQLESAVAKAHAVLLDRSQPLWQFTMFDGLASGEIALYAKIHHAALDGQGGVVLASAILDLTAVPRVVPMPTKTERTPKADVTVGKMIGAAFSNTLAQYAKIVKSLPTVASAVKQAASPMLKKALDSKSVPMEFAPRTPFNVNITSERVFATATLSFDAVRAAARVLDASFNDGVLFICSSALRAYLKSHNALPRKSLVVAMPVSLREGSNKELNNQASMVLAQLGTHHGDARKRWNAVRASTTKVKDSLKSLKNVLPTDYPGLLAPLLMSRLNATVASTKLMERLPPIANLVISNVPGPQVPLYLAGAEMQTFYPVSIIVHGIALNITVQTYRGSVDFGILACKKAAPDIHKLATAMNGAFDELVALAEAESALSAERSAEAKNKAQPSHPQAKTVVARKQKTAKAKAPKKR